MNTSARESFVTGKIKHIHLENFMTYEAIDFYPKEYLNVILGPNGTGKSTLVSAILIGMGGDFKKIGRATHLKDYIKYGLEKASIEITLFQNEQRDPITFRRDITARGTSRYFLNNRPVEESRYMSTVGRFNIQVDNLCQFLPQDRVQDFALMNPHEILINTQKSVLLPKVSEQFSKLLEYENFDLNFHAQSTRLEDQIAKEEAENERLKPVVERMQQRNAMVEKLNVAYMKQKWLSKVELEKKLVDYQRDVDLAKSSVMEKASSLAPIQNAAGRAMKAREGDKKLIEEATKLSDMGKVQMRQLQNKLEVIEGQMMDSAQNFSLKVSELAQRKTETRKLEVERMKGEQEIIELEEQLKEEEQRVNLKELQAKMAQSRKQKNDLLEKRNELEEAIDGQLKPKIIALENRVANMRSKGDQRMEGLRQQNPQLYEAVHWVRENRGLFEGKIYDPMILELNVKKNEYVKYFENTISMNDLMAFTCERTSDSIKLVERLAQRNLRCNVLHSQSANKVGFEPIKPISAYQHLGLHSYLLQLVDAPVPILNYLCRMYAVHNIPVGDQRAVANLARIQSETDFKLMYVGDLRLYTKKSAYSNDTMRGTNQINSRNLLSVGIDESVIEAQEKQLLQLKREMDKMRNQRSQLEGQIEFFLAKEEEWKNTQQELSTRQGQVKAKRMQLNNIKLKLNRLKAMPQSIDAENQANEKLLRELMKKRMMIHQQQVTGVGALIGHVNQLKVLKKKLLYRDRETAEYKSSLEAAKVRVDDAKQLYQTIQQSLNETREKIQSLKNQFVQLAKEDSPDARKFAHKAIYRQLPNELEALQEQILFLRTSVECLNQDDETQFLQFENRKKLIMELKEQLAGQTERRGSVLQDMQKLREEWLPQVLEMVVEVNENFQRFMQSIDVVGEVQLITNEQHRYSEFGIGIRVKYRDNGPFLILDRYHHSGGERAVAIATYTLSLQKISQVPFRCVDEINQGMDPDNERKVFNMLVDEAAQPGRAQYFFVSPKFQPEVKANRYTTFHIIDSGKYLTDSNVFNCSSNSMVVDLD